MAAKDRAKESNKKDGAKNGGGGRRKQSQSAIRSEIIAIIIIAAAVLVLISLFLEDAGLIGRLVNSLMLGLFGVGAFVVPMFALMYGGILLVNKTDILRTSKMIMGAVVFLLFISVAHMLISAPRPEDISAWQYIGYVFTAGSAGGGGLLGAATSRLFIAALSEVGTYILFFTTLAVLIILITGRSLFVPLQGGFFKVKREIEAGSERRRARREELVEEEEDFEPQDIYIPVPRKGVNNIVMTEQDEDELVSDEISLIKGEMGPRPAVHKTTPMPKHKKDIIFEGEEEPPEPPQLFGFEVVDAEQELENLDEIDFPDEEFTINVRGIVEGYKPAAVQLEDLEKEEETPPPFEDNLLMRAEQPVEEEPVFHSEEYIFPPVELLRENTYRPSLSSRAQILENSKKLEETLQSFGVAAKVVEVSKGPTVTRYELSPGSGVKVSKISGLADDLALNLAAQGIRIEAPIPGKSVVGIEIPNKDVQAVFLREVIDDDAFWNYPSKICFAMGKDIAGNIVIADIAKMPHLLIAGATGAGKSVCINTLITSIIYKAAPHEVKLLMIDPKVVELSVYNGIPHLLIPVVTDPKKASGALAWAVREMDERYNLFAETKVRDLAGYNDHLTADGLDRLPQIVIIIDELADLMMTCGKEVEESICRLAQKARAAGIHLIIATQRPSVDVITGLIKANVPSRLAFAVSSGTDSRTILDMVGAEKLLGKGDMLFSPVGLSKPQRIQGSFISDKEVENIVNFIKQDGDVEYSEEMIEQITTAQEPEEFSADSDPFTEEAIAFIVEREKASTSMLQRRFRIGYNRAARLMEELVARGLVGPEDGAKPRKVLMTSYQYREYLERKKNV